MPVALLDTNAVSDLMRDHAALKSRIASHLDVIATSAIVVGELWYGLDRLPAGKKRTDLQTRAEYILAALRIDPITQPIAEAYGHLKATTEGQGLNLDDNDLWIAATAIVGGHVLVSRDQIFGRIPGVPVENWSA
jgi:predicted nucleic acid-binding protein